ncbi:MAG: transketolase C-terminal domain-containing protein [Ignavibacteria bacterium]
MIETTKKIKLRNGNQMIAEGAIYAGCKFFAGYPITPASGIYKGMIDMLPQVGGLAIPSPDEISAIAYCVGASMRGFKSMTATSGPGWSLMIETVQYALITETPIVIAVVQRLGPATGGATQGAQGDILFTQFITSGGYTIPVLYPTNPKECFELTVKAFNWSEKLRTPVVLLSDKEIGMTTETVDYTGLENLVIENRSTIDPEDLKNKNWKMYDFENLGDIPLFAPVGGKIKVTATGSAHNKEGELKKNDPETISVLKHLEEKIQAHRDELIEYKLYEVKDAETLIISFGITGRTSLEVLRRLKNSNKKVSVLILYSLFPIPEKLLKNVSEKYKKVIIAEENLNGQYRLLIKHLFDGKEVIGVNKIGSMITPQEIMEKI